MVVLDKRWISFLTVMTAVWGVLPSVCEGVEVSGLSHAVRFDESGRGQVTGLVTRAGVEFHAAYSNPLFAVTLRRVDDLTRQVIVEASDATVFSHRRTDSGAVEFAYSGFKEAVASVRCAVRGDPETGRIRWRIAVRPCEGWAVCETAYPQLALAPKIGASDEDDAILTGESGKTGLKRRPVANKFHVDCWQPFYLAVQMACYYDPSALLLFACEDGQGEAKRLHGWAETRNGGGLTLIWRHMGWNTDGAKVPYDVVTAALDGTDLTWHDGADLYRLWAQRQRWCRTPWKDRPDIPAWLKEFPAYADMGSGWRTWVDRPGLLNRWAKDYWKVNYPRSKLAFHFDGWERGGVYVMTDYFPLYPTTAAYTALAADLSANNVLPFPWPSGYRRADAFGKRADGTFEIDEREAFARDFVSHACTLPDASVNYRRANWLKGGHMAYMCGGDPWTLDWFTEKICAALACCKTPLLSGDQNIGGGFDECWNRHHPHAPGYGRWMTDSIRRQIPRAVAALREHSADAAFCYEEPNEQINDLVTFNNVRESYDLKEEWAGLFSYLYHEYAPIFPISRTGRYGRAYNLAMGLIPQVTMEFGDVDHESLLLPNGGFEELESDGRTCRSWETGPFCLPNGLDTAQAHSGRRSMRVERPEGTNKWVHVAMSLSPNDDALTPGRCYRLGAWLKVARGALRLDLGFFRNGKAIGWTQVRSDQADVGGGWRHVTAEFTCPPGERSLVRFMANAAPGTLGWFDDVSLEERAPDGSFSPARLRGCADKTRLQREWIALYGGEGRAWLAYGRRVKPPAVTCAQIEVGGRSAPSVVCGAYLSQSGEKAWALANGSSDVQTASWKEDGIRYSVTLRPDEAKIVRKKLK